MRLLWIIGFFFVVASAFAGCERHLELGLEKESLRTSATQTTQTDSEDGTSTSSDTDSATQGTSTAIQSLEDRPIER